MGFKVKIEQFKKKYVESPIALAFSSDFHEVLSKSMYPQGTDRSITTIKMYCGLPVHILPYNDTTDFGILSRHNRVGMLKRVSKLL